MGHGLNMGMDSWGVVWECGNLVVDGGKRERRGVEIISWWSAWGERCVIGFWGPGGGGDWGEAGGVREGKW